MAAHPITRFKRWFAKAGRADLPQPEAMALATADRRGTPSLRYVLMKEADESGVVFFTNTASRKGKELRANPRAALTFYWSALGKQVRVEGRVEPVSEEEADAYWKTRPRASQLAALSSRQSEPLESRAALMRRYKRLAERYRGSEVPRPPGWSGYRLVPETVEFWTHRDHRLHHRELFTRAGKSWKRTLLQP
jgi:pyridoxamine 5'-phosphate oxidase